MTSGPEAGTPPCATAAPVLVEHFFRHEYGRLVALLTRKVGVRHIGSVEDAVQGALLTALTAWTAQGLPDDPGGWLSRVAYNLHSDISPSLESTTCERSESRLSQKTLAVSPSWEAS